MSQKVLIVDDEPEIVQLTQSVLLKHGYEVNCVSSGEEALESIQDQLPDLIIIDYRLPGTNGDEIVHQLKKDPARQHIPIIMCTAQALMKSPTGGNPRLIKPDGYLIKPFEIQELLELVRSLLG